MYTILFDEFLKDLNEEKEESLIYSDMINLKWILSDYKEKATPAEKVRDYLAGMTDRYFEWVFKKITIPERVTRNF